MAAADAAVPRVPALPDGATASVDSTPGSSRGSFPGRWPHDLSHDPSMRVSDVLALVGSEFPALSASKLRFLDAEGLVTPVRTGGGYRHYSPADVERLRFVLLEQRDRYAPLDVIAERLARLDEGREQRNVRPHEVAEDVPPHLGLQEVAERAGAPRELVTALAEAGVIATSVGDKFPASAIDVARAASEFVGAGGDVREIRTLRNAADREVAAARARAAAQPNAAEAVGAGERRAEAAIALFSALVRRETSSD